MESFQADLDAIAKIEAVPTILEIICRVTGTGLAAVARVTEDRWIACGVRDEDAFGMQVGDELDIQTTFCRQVRSTGEPVIINNAAGDEVYCSHPIPAMYGIRSYISVPIRRGDGSVFGTLCRLARSRPR